jgi:lipoic acid synthetase
MPASPGPVVEWSRMQEIPLTPTRRAGRPEDTRPMHLRLLPDGVDRRPDWLTVKLPIGDGYAQVKSLMRGLDLVTVCEEARCPNIAECWSHGTATFMILGEVCTRACAFCAVTSGKRGGDVDADEPRRVGEAVARMGLAHAVVTSVDRDDLPDFGAGLFAQTIAEIRRQAPGTTIEVLTPDFNGRLESLEVVMAARPEIFNHNLETIERLYARVRPKAGYRQSLTLLKEAKRLEPRSRTKSGLMVGLGEEMEEVKVLLDDLHAHDVEIVTIGQYLRPSLKHHPLIRFWTPAEFAELKAHGLALGFSHVESGPLVRSSYHAHEQAVAASAV